jgi:hypothetical protein
MRRSRPSVHDLAAEIIRRAAGKDGAVSYVVRLSDPPPARERLQLMATHLARRPIVIMPHRCKTVEEWTAPYDQMKYQVSVQFTGDVRLECRNAFLQAQFEAALRASTMAAKATRAHLQWLTFLHANGSVRGDNFANKVKGTCARRNWATWDGHSTTWTITKAGLLVLGREKAPQGGGSGSSLRA